MELNYRKHCFEQLIEQKLPMFRGIAFRILKNVNDADDAIQDALLKAYQRFGTFRNEADLSSWVSRIVITCCYDLLRKRQREKEALEGYEPDNEAPTDTSELEEAIAYLPEPYRDAITFGVLSGMDGKAAAELLGISQNTLYQRIFKAKQMLKIALQAKGE